MEIVENNIALELTAELEWLEKVINTSLTLYFKNDSDITNVLDIEPPALNKESTYGSFLTDNEFSLEDRFILLLSLAPILKPQSLDVFKIKNTNLNAEFSEFGGIREGNKQSFIPTLETAIFVLSIDDLSKRLHYLSLFNHSNKLFKEGVLTRESDVNQILEQPLRVSPEVFNRITTGESALPEYGSGFLAQEIKSSLKWEDLVVDDSVRLSLSELEDWLKYRALILEDWEFSKSLKKGYRALFYGPPGTGKTLAATLVGQSCQKEVFRIDLSMVVSTYIGETEKNIAGLFDMAEGNNWILFFDEADSLFGKRTQTKGSNDRYANQEVSYLLQRIEDYQGLVILATNLKDNIDDAFSRRFQTTVQFNKPGVNERRILWENYIFSQPTLWYYTPNENSDNSDRKSVV